MSEAILLNQYPQNNGGGGNPWDIPPFNWYGKGVIVSNKAPTNHILPNSTPTGTEALETFVNVSGKGALYFATTYLGGGAYILKITIDDVPILFQGYYLNTSISYGYGGITCFTANTIQTHSYGTSNLGGMMPSLRAVTNMLDLPKKTFRVDNHEKVDHAFFTPVIFNKNLKIEFAASQDRTLSYMYDLFDE